MPPEEPVSSILPDASSFETPVYGTVFGERARVVHRLSEGDQLILVPDPPGVEQPNVWVHAPGGDVVGHLSPDINRWLVPWHARRRALRRARAATSASDDVASWKRLVITVRSRARRCAARLHDHRQLPADVLERRESPGRDRRACAPR